MEMTITEKILAEHAGKSHVEPGEIVYCKVDLALANDITAPLAIESFYKMGAKKVFDSEKVVLVPDHFTPNKDIQSAQQCKVIRQFVKEQGIKHYFEVGRMGVEHALLPELGLVKPGDLVIGADSHTCTYGALGAFSTGVGSTDLAACWATGEIWLKVPESMKLIFYGKPRKWVGGKDLILFVISQIGTEGARYKAMEFEGETLRYLSMDHRLTITNMVVEAGAKNGIMAPDDLTVEYFREKGIENIKLLKSDSDARYNEIFEIDVSQIEPLVACPPSPANVKRAKELSHIEIDQVVIGSCTNGSPPSPANVKRAKELSHIEIDQVVIGSCTNGRIEDLRIAAQILKGRKVAPWVRLIVIPATQGVYLKALKEGLIEIFIQAGGAVSTPTCGPCLGGHMGVLAEGERALATTNRNFVGRMGHPKSEVYLSNPAVAAASAILGRIADPEEVLKE